MYCTPINITEKLMQYHRSKSGVILRIYIAKYFISGTDRLTDRLKVTGHVDMSAAWAV